MPFGYCTLLPIPAMQCECLSVQTLAMILFGLDILTDKGCWSFSINQ